MTLGLALKFYFMMSDGVAKLAVSFCFWFCVAALLASYWRLWPSRPFGVLKGLWVFMNNGLSIITNVILAQTDLFREQIHLGSWQGPENRTHSVAGAPSFVRFSGPCQEPRRICKKSWCQHKIGRPSAVIFFEIGVFANITLVIITKISKLLI